MKLYFIRHGQTDGNAGNILSRHDNSAEVYDEGLNDKGYEQAQELAKKLRDSHFDAIISSPLKRARQTAEIINQYHNLPITSDNSWSEIAADSYIDADTWRDLFDASKDIRTENGENLKDLFARVRNAIEKLKSEFAGKTVLVVSHGGPQHVLYAYANNLPLSGNMRISPMRTGEYRIYEL
jgi:broad specificity phosphatase PhoE